MLERVRPTQEDFIDLYEREYPRLAQACLLLTGSTAEAEDLVQEAFVRVYARWDAVREMESREGYLFRTALNLNRKRLRRLSVRARHGSDPEPQRASIEAIDERLDALRAVAALPRAQREALVLVEWLDLDANEAATLLGIAASTVRGRIHRARLTLRERYGVADG